MPTIRLATYAIGHALQATSAAGPPAVPRVQLRTLLRIPGALFPRDAIIDTGAPLIFFPEEIWKPLQEGIDFEWVPLDPAVSSPTARVTDWTFDFRMARFLAPLALLDYSIEVERPDIVAAFAVGNPPAYASRKSLPPVIVGLWGGLLEGGKIAVGRDPASGHVTGSLEFP
jgi:hypothetical protein